MAIIVSSDNGGVNEPYTMNIVHLNDE
jgi:hypothetical protein